MCGRGLYLRACVSFTKRTRPFLFCVRFFLATFAGLENQYVCPPVRAGGGLLAEPVQSEFSSTESVQRAPKLLLYHQ